MKKTVYILGLLNSDHMIVGAETCGEAPWEMTRDSSRTEHVILYMASGPTFADALAKAKDGYESFLPNIANRFPIRT